MSSEHLNAAKSQLASASYLLDMLLEAEYGKMNVAQSELVHKVQTAVQASMTALEAESA